MGAETDTKDRVITLLEHRIDDLKRQQQQEIERFREIHDQSKREVDELHKEKIKELIAQNDGMLGVVGRLQTDNDNLKKTVAHLESHNERLLTQAKMMEQQATLEMERVKQEAIRQTEDLKGQIERLKKKGKR